MRSRDRARRGTGAIRRPSRGRGRGDGQEVADTLEIGFDAQEVGIGSGGPGIVEEAIDPLVLGFEPGQGIGGPEGRGIADEICGGGKGHGRMGCGIVGGDLGELGMKGGEFVHVIGCGHLAEEIGGGEGATDSSVEGILEREAGHAGIERGAKDHELRGGDVGFGEAFGAQDPGGQVGAAPDMDGGEFGAGSDAIAAGLQVSGVVEEDGDEAEEEGPVGEGRLTRGVVPTEEELGEADGALEGVFEVVVAGVEGFEVRVVTGEGTLHPGEDAAQNWRRVVSADDPPGAFADVQHGAGVPGVHV